MADKWQSERPTAGKWWVAIHPERRRLRAAVQSCEITKLGAWLPGIRGPINISDCLFDGALWMPREVPADPFARQT